MEKPAVLLLERNATVIEAAQRILADEVELHVANSLDLALKIAGRRPIVVAVMDATMAGASPLDTVVKLRANRPGLRVVFLAEPAFDLDRRYGQLGPVVRKPLVVERFTDVIRNALRLSSMSAGVQRMRTSSGSFPAVHVPDPQRVLAAAPSANASASPSSPPSPFTPSAAFPPETEPGDPTRESGTALKTTGPGGEPRRLTPAPFAKVR